MSDGLQAFLKAVGVIALVIGGMLVFTMILAQASREPITLLPMAPPPAAALPSAGPTAPPNPGITLDKYSRLTPGMTYQQVSQIMGSPGEVDFSHESAATRFSRASSYHSISWNNSDMGHARVMFQDNRLESKSQFGLK